LWNKGIARKIELMLAVDSRLEIVGKFELLLLAVFVRLAVHASIENMLTQIAM
jgi:hypothetical protein